VRKKDLHVDRKEKKNYSFFSPHLEVGAQNTFTTREHTPFPHHREPKKEKREPPTTNKKKEKRNKKNTRKVIIISRDGSHKETPLTHKPPKKIKNPLSQQKKFEGGKREKENKGTARARRKKGFQRLRSNSFLQSHPPPPSSPATNTRGVCVLGEEKREKEKKEKE